jgi:hypothetical protein
MCSVFVETTPHPAAAEDGPLPASPMKGEVKKGFAL